MAGEIFISYRRVDQSKAKLLHDLLKQRGVDAWYDALLDAGDDWRNKTANALVKAPIFVLLFSKAASESDDISKELAAATFQKKTVIPVRIDNIHPEGAFLYELASRNWFDAFDDTEARLTLLADRLAALVKGGADAAVAAQTLGAPMTAAQSASPTPAAPPRAPPRKFYQNPAIVAGLAGLVILLIAGAFFLTRLPTTPTPPKPPGQAASGAGNERIVFFGFSDDGGGVTRAIAAKANDETYRVLNLMKFDVVPRSDAMAQHANSSLDRARDLGARIAIEGSMRADGGKVNVVYALMDVPTRKTILQSNRTFDERIVGRAPYFLGQGAISLASCAVSYLASYGARTPEPSTLPLIGQACVANYTNGFAVAARELAKRNPEGVVEAAQLASGLVWSIPSSPEAMRPAMLAEADQALARAEKLGPDNFATADARIAVAVVHGRPPLDWLPTAETALQRAPTPPETRDYAKTSSVVGWMMMQLGRTREGARYMQMAVESDPNNTLWRYYDPFARAAANQYNAYGERFQDVLAQRSSGYSWEVALNAAIFLGAFDPEVALAAVGDGEKDVVPCYRGLIASLKARDAKTRLTGARKADACLFAFNSPHVNIMAQSALGDLDRAFAIADQPNLTLSLWTYFPPFFLPPTRAMRADSRFLPLMQKAGYVDYWKQTKSRPDVCDTAEERDIPLCAALR